MNYYGVLIHRERLRRNWSQEGLCRGICAVSYLSKIEQGKAVPSEDVLHLLLERLGLSCDQQTEATAKALAEQAYEALFSADRAAFWALRPKLQNPRLAATPAGLDLLLLGQWGAEPRGSELDAELETCMDSRQLAIQRNLQGREEEAVRLCPNGFFYFCAGVAMYEQGGYYPKALEYLQTAYDLAAREGAPRLMMEVRMFMGNCYCNQLDVENMLLHYQIARRLAKALEDDHALATMDYNAASAQLEAGDFAQAYAYFSAQADAGVMVLHKLAICCEKLGKVQQAKDALDKADTLDCDYPPVPLARQMCAVVRYRLNCPDYLKREEYGTLLLSCFAQLRRQLPIGYASFHLPWVLEWYTATRQYKKAYELISEFPLKHTLKQV